MQPVPSPKAEPIQLWLARVGYERMQEIAHFALTLDRARQTLHRPVVSAGNPLRTPSAN